MNENRTVKKELCNGVFWVNDDVIISVKYPCTSDGKLICADNETEEKLMRKLANHKKLWEHILPCGRKVGFDYYPRGRVEITPKGKAVIYMSPHIEDKYIAEICTAFDLITEPIVKYDHSEHYHCYLDR